MSVCKENYTVYEQASPTSSTYIALFSGKIVCTNCGPCTYVSVAGLRARSFGSARFDELVGSVQNERLPLLPQVDLNHLQVDV